MLYKRLLYNHICRLFVVRHYSENIYLELLNGFSHISKKKSLMVVFFRFINVFFLSFTGAKNYLTPLKIILNVILGHCLTPKMLLCKFSKGPTSMLQSNQIIIFRNFFQIQHFCCFRKCGICSLQKMIDNLYQFSLLLFLSVNMRQYVYSKQRKHTNTVKQYSILLY